MQAPSVTQAMTLPQAQRCAALPALLHCHRHCHRDSTPWTLIHFPNWRPSSHSSHCRLDSTAAQPVATVGNPFSLPAGLTREEPRAKSRAPIGTLQAPWPPCTPSRSGTPPSRRRRTASQVRTHQLEACPMISISDRRASTLISSLIARSEPRFLQNLELLSWRGIAEAPVHEAVTFLVSVLLKSSFACADVIRSANAAACQPVLPGQPLHKHSSAPGSTAMGRQFRGSRDLQPWATEPLLRSRSENAMRAPTPTEETDSLRSREPSPEAVSEPHLLNLLQVHGRASSGLRLL